MILNDWAPPAEKMLNGPEGDTPTVHGGIAQFRYECSKAAAIQGLQWGQQWKVVRKGLASDVDIFLPIDRDAGPAIRSQAPEVRSEIQANPLGASTTTKASYSPELECCRASAMGKSTEVVYPVA